MRGMSEAEVRAKLDGIIAFSGLEHVIDEERAEPLCRLEAVAGEEACRRQVVA